MKTRIYRAFSRKRFKFFSFKVLVKKVVALVRVEFVSIVQRELSADSAKALAFQATVRLRCPKKWQEPTLRSCFLRVESRGRLSRGFLNNL